MAGGLRAVNPAIVYTVISGFGISGFGISGFGISGFGISGFGISGFGLPGPYREFRPNDFLDLASGGQLYLTGYPDRHPVQAGVP